MKERESRKIMRTGQKIVQAIFLVLFAVLIMAGKMQLWVGIFALSVLLAIFFGRFYCGWLCPINTLMKATTWVKKKLKIGSLKIPQLLTHPFFRYAFLALFLLTFAFVMKTGHKLPVLPSLLIMGIGLTLFFPEELWHRYLCPYGTILHFSGARSQKALVVNPELCNSCGRCSKVCSGGAIWRSSDKKYHIDRGLCLLCLDCVAVCPQGAISYQHKSKAELEQRRLHDA